MNGKGSSPRNCFSKQFKNNYDLIKWNHKKKKTKRKRIKYIDIDNKEPECDYCGKIYCDCPTKY